ncbi:MAG TPA: ketopantoate reductase C-terminal domain-containing protein, partial [Gemmataceae bacterium]|nr:ketopantoate reductase C-terminal domain-containing protein [Gemmataceae bacterium]
AVGNALLRAGVPVTFVEANPDKVCWGRAHGVRVDGQGPHPADLIDFADWSPPAGATVLLCTKCYDNAAVLARLPASVTVLPIQNGFDRSLDGRGGDLEGIASFVSECLPGRTHTRITRNGRLHLGPRRAGAAVAPPDWVAALRRQAPFRVEWVPDIRPYKYTKLMYNAAISPLAAAAGLDNGQLLWLPRARRLLFALLRENYAILRGAGVPLGVIGPFHPDTVQRILRHPALARALAWAFYPTLKGTYCSMSGDLPAGRTEIDYYNGHLIELAGDRPCPLNRQVHALVRRMERERIPPGPSVLDGLTE